MRPTRYRRYFVDYIRSSSAVFHSALIYPNEYEVVRAVTHIPTDAPVTVRDRLTPSNQSYRLDRFIFWVISEWPLGHAARRALVDRPYYAGQPVTWRNYEASLDGAALAPTSRERSTYALQQDFVPPDRFADFCTPIPNVLRPRP